MNYKDLQEGQIFNFIDHPKEDIFLRMDRGFIRIPNKFANTNMSIPFPDSERDVYLLTKKQIYTNVVLKRTK
jgi:hypothetical protein